MDLGSPGNGFEELNDLLKDDDSSMVGELGLSFIVNKEEINASNYGFDDNLARSNELCVDVNEQGQQAPPSSLPSEFPYYDFPRSPEKFPSPLETGFDTVALCEKKNEELLQSPLKDFDQQDGTEELCCSYLSAFPSQVESATPQHELQAEVSGHLVESPLRQEAAFAQELEMEDRPASPPHEAIMEETFLDMSACESAVSEFGNKQVEEEVLEHPAEIVHISPRLCVDEYETDNDHINHSRNSPLYMSVYEAVISESANEQVQEEVLEHSTEILHTSSRLRVDESETDNYHIHHSRNSPVESRNPEMSLSPRNPEMSIAVDMFPGSVKACSSPKSLGSRGRRQRSSPQMSDIVERVDYSLPSGRKDSTSPLRSRQSKRPTDVSSSKRSSISPRNHHLHQNHGRRDRSRLKSPVRRKETYSRQKTKYHDRSRSRSPYKRDYHRSLRRSPRRRHSPRRKSPPSDYHSSRRSPRRRPWSPPHNRSTGLGKPGRILFVAGFSFLTTERDLERKFSRFGRVRDVRIVRDKRSGDSRGFGFLTLDRDEEADAAIRALDKTEWNGRIVLVEKSKSH